MARPAAHLMETHERLDDEIMGYAHSRWYDIENGIEDD